MSSVANQRSLYTSFHRTNYLLALLIQLAWAFFDEVHYNHLNNLLAYFYHRTAIEQENQQRQSYE